MLCTNAYRSGSALFSRLHLPKEHHFRAVIRSVKSFYMEMAGGRILIFVTLLRLGAYSLQLNDLCSTFDSRLGRCVAAENCSLIGRIQRLAPHLRSSAESFLLMHSECGSQGHRGENLVSYLKETLFWEYCLLNYLLRFSIAVRYSQMKKNAEQIRLLIGFTVALRLILENIRGQYNWFISSVAIAISRLAAEC